MNPEKTMIQSVKIFCLIRARGPTLTNIINLFLEKKVATLYILMSNVPSTGKKLLPVQKNHEMV